MSATTARRTAEPAAELDRPGHVGVPYPSGESWTRAIARVGRVLDYLEPRWTHSRVLVIGHTATRWAFDHLVDGVPIAVEPSEPFTWQEGWEYRLKLIPSDASLRSSSRRSASSCASASARW